MNSLPSPAESPSTTPRESPPSFDNRTHSRKRARSSASSSDASSSKRALSEDPSVVDPPEGVRSRAQTASTSRSDENGIDAYMADQGEEDEGQITLQPLPSSSSFPSVPDINLLPATFRHAYVIAERKKPMSSGATWYLVARSWYRRWEKACTGEVDKEGPVEESQLGPVDNSSLVDEAGNLSAESLDEGVDVEYVSEQVWELFEKFYGKAKYPLPRKVITRGLSKELSLEIYPPELKVLRLIPADNSTFVFGSDPVKRLIISSQATLSELFPKLLRLLDLERCSDDEYRIWKVECEIQKGDQFPSGRLLQDGGHRLPLPHDPAEPANTLEASLIESGDVLLVEKKTNGQWVVDESRVPKSGSTSGATGPLLPAMEGALAPLFQSGTDFFSRLTPVSSTKAIPSTTKASSTSLVPKNTITIPGGKALEKPRTPGIMGLGNMGNTCFMNSALQCLAHTQELIDYFLTGVYRTELNPDNPLGMHGAIAEAFGALLERLWSTSFPSSSYSPREFKNQLQRFAPQFSGYQQHDSQELVAFLLDGLHEDLNRVKKKPYVEKPDWNGGGDKELVQLANESWEGYMKRNDSVIVDLFQGQYQSTLVCPECQKVSITFDPFMYLTLPLPIQKKWRHTIYYVPWDLESPPLKVPVEISRNASFKDLRKLLGRWLEAEADHLLTLEVFSNKFYKNLDDNAAVSDMSDSDIIVCYELPCHAQQSRSWKPDENPAKNPLIVPVYLGKDTAQRSTFQRGLNGFAQPFVIVLNYEQACDQQQIYEAVVDRLQRWTLRPDELYQWDREVVSHGNSGFSTPARFVIPEISGSDSVDEVGEGDIVDEKLQFQEPDEVIVVDDTEIVKTGCKPELFQMRIQSGHEKYGTGHSWSTNQNWISCESRESLASPGPLIRDGDVLSCEWDDNLRAYYFGDEQGPERSTWDPAGWDAFVHPEYKESQVSAHNKSKRGITLQDCLDEFTKEEQLGEDDLWYCPSCKKHQQATKKFDLWKVPDILVVHLKRFSNSRALRDKIDVFVDFPIEGLDLEPLVGERKTTKRLLAEGIDPSTLSLPDPEEPLVYDLYGVDEHLGGLGGGHYRAYAQHHQLNKWYHFDDSFVSPARATDAVNANAYLLFYKRRSSKPIGGKTHEKVEAARKTPPEEHETGTQLPTPPDDQSPRGSSGLSSLSGLTVFPSPQASSDPWPTPSTDDLSPLSSSPPPADERVEGPPGFEDSQFDHLVLGSRYRTPTGSATAGHSPSSSNEVEPDLDRGSDSGEPSGWGTPNYNGWAQDPAPSFSDIAMSSSSSSYKVWGQPADDSEIIEVDPFADEGASSV